MAIDLSSSISASDRAFIGKLEASNGLPKNLKGLSAEKIDKAAQDFEAVFLTQMLEHMFPEKMDPFGSEESDDVYRGWMIEEYGKRVAKAGGIGIASQVREEMLKLQDIAYGRGNEKVAAALNAKEPRFFELKEHATPMFNVER